MVSSVSVTFRVMVVFMVLMTSRVMVVFMVLMTSKVMVAFSVLMTSNVQIVFSVLVIFRLHAAAFSYEERQQYSCRYYEQCQVQSQRCFVSCPGVAFKCIGEFCLDGVISVDGDIE